MTFLQRLAKNCLQYLVSQLPVPEDAGKERSHLTGMLAVQARNRFRLDPILTVRIRLTVRIWHSSRRLVRLSDEPTLQVLARNNDARPRGFI
jgi:hypothetical protein